MHGVSRHRAAARSANAADQAGGEPAGFRHPYPCRTTWFGHRLARFKQQLIAQHPRHLHRLLHHPIAAGAAAHRGLVPLGHGIGDAAGQGARWRLAHQVVVKHQQVWAAIQGHITLECSFWGVEVGQGCPAGACRGAGGHGDAGQPMAMGQQFAGIEHLAAACGHHRITALGGQVVAQALQLALAAVVSKRQRRYRCTWNVYVRRC